MELRVLIVLCDFLFLAVNANEKIETVKLCVVSSNGKAAKHCDLLGKTKKSPVTCLYAEDRLDCLRLVSSGRADLMAMEPEDLYFSTLWEESSVLVVGEMRALRNQTFNYGAVVVVKKDLNLSGTDLRGLKLCHPGLKSGIKWNDMFAEYLEERLAPRECDPKMSVFEDRAKTSSNYFRSSCKAGPWVEDREEDVRLKNEYSVMCSLCEMGNCENSEKYRGSGGSLLCLTDGIGDVLWARYDDVRNFFKKFDSWSKTSASDFRLLCEDGTLKSIEDEDPCLWLAMPWQVIGANRRSVKDVQKVLYQFHESGEWEQHFMAIIESYMHYVVNLYTPKTPEDYLKIVPGYLSALDLSKGNCNPKRSIRLCTSTSIEQKKCIWMSKAAISLAVQPSLDCVQKSNVSDCLSSVKNRTADLVVVPPDYLLEATTKHGLTTVYTEMPHEETDGYTLTARVRDDSNLKRLSDLRQKRACFTREGGVGWNGALKALKTEHLIDSICEGRQGLKKFFEDAYVVDSVDSCRPCNLNSSGQPEIDLLNCLSRGGCDVAFLDSHTTVDESQFKTKNLRYICRDGKSLNCTWYWSYPSYLMINPQTDAPKYQEINELVNRLGNVFGRNLKNINPIMEIFGPFLGNSNVLFKDTSVDFARLGHWIPTNDYSDIVDELTTCSASSQCYKSIFILLLIFVLNAL